MLRIPPARSAAALAFAIMLSGCALSKTHAVSQSAARDARPVVNGAVEPVSFRKPPPLRTSRPIGLTPCEHGAFQLAECWRKGDEHILFPSTAPRGEASALTPPAEAD